MLIFSALLTLLHHNKLKQYITSWTFFHCSINPVFRSSLLCITSQNIADSFVGTNFQIFTTFIIRIQNHISAFVNMDTCQHALYRINTAKCSYQGHLYIIKINIRTKTQYAQHRDPIHQALTCPNHMYFLCSVAQISENVWKHSRNVSNTCLHMGHNPKYL